MRIKLLVADLELNGELNESPVARALAERLPVEIRASRWGDEYYGAVGLGMDNDRETREEVEIGTLAYWPTGDSLCIFFGPTPMSSGDVPRAASPVSVIGLVPAAEAVRLRPLGEQVSVVVQPAS